MHPSLKVDGPAWARTGADLVALAGIVSFIAAFWFDGIAVALMALVLLGLTVARVTALPALLQILTGILLIVAAWASLLDWYVAYEWLDIVIHFAANGLLAVVVIVFMRQFGALPKKIPPVGIIVVTTALGALLAVLWEAGEWAGHTLLNDDIGVGYDDTIGDLVSGTAGSFAAGLALAWKDRRE